MDGLVTAIGILQARMGSERFPGKVLAPIQGKPMVAFLIERLRPADLRLVLATTTSPADDILALWGGELGVQVHRGPIADVLERFLGVLDEEPAEWVVRLTGDNPLVHPDVIDSMVAVASAADESVELISSDGTTPAGFVPEVVRSESLRRLADTDLEAHHRTHVTSGIEPAGRDVFSPVGAQERSRWRWTVDEPSDYEMLQALVSTYPGNVMTATYRDLVAHIDNNQWIARINENVRQKDLREG